MIQKRLLLTVLLFVTASVTAQNRALPLVTRAVDETETVRIPGSMHPLAQPRYDRGAVPDEFPARRLLVLLNRPASRAVALQGYLADAHNPGTSTFHKWITPDQFGERFGPADSDVQIAVTWLKSHGFTVLKVARSKQFVELSGAAGQLREAFHTEIHRYEIDGVSHHANSSEISVPQALAPLIRGVAGLNDFRAKPQLHELGRASYQRATGKTTPQWTIPNPNGNFYALAPADFVTQYNLAPLYQAGVDGSGQTIGIINESNIDLSLVSSYQQLFGLPSNPTQVVIDGNDPGELGGVNVEAYLDVEVAGAVAPKATVNLYIANENGLQDPLALAALRAIEDNQASILSVSFGLCESLLGNDRNALWAGLWEQAAAQGQTVLVASGDSSSACDPPHLGYAFMGLGVNGLASTPWNIAVGGTDFYYSDYAEGAPSASDLWNQTNDSNLGSLKDPLPEQVWNDFLGFDVLNPYGLGRVNPIGGGGGASSCSNKSDAGTCSGYAKPEWQTGSGVPGDGARDLPDVSLFAANGANLSAYPICAFAGECLTGGDSVEITVVGGTSASTPAMAGIMALINQKYGRQGQANHILYALAQQNPSAFHDVTLGSNNVECLKGSPDCELDPDGLYYLQKYDAAAGYDQASGLGSVDATQLVNSWNSVTRQSTTTTLHLSPTNVTHGTPITAAVTVAGAGGGAPTGNVAIITNSPLPANQGQTFLTLSGGTATGSVDFLPGGSYQVYADYHGNTQFSGSKSAGVAVAITAEDSNINFTMTNYGTPVPKGGTVAYNDAVSLQIQPTGVSAPAGKNNGIATGSANFTVDSISATVPLNSSGVASWALQALSVGTHTASARYSGDASFHASSTTAFTFTVEKGYPNLNEQMSVPLGNFSDCMGRCLGAGGAVTIAVEVGPYENVVGTQVPTGNVTLCLGGFNFSGACIQPVYSQTIPLSSRDGINSRVASAAATFSNLAQGSYYFSFQYSGDANWREYGLIDTGNIEVLPSTVPNTTTSLTITPDSISGLQVATLSATVSAPPGATIAPTGWVTFFDNDWSAPYLEFYYLQPSATDATASFTGSWFSPYYFASSGDNRITAVYSGDANYLPSTSTEKHIVVTQTAGDFLFAPQLPQIAVKAGATATVGMNLTSAGNFNGTVTLSCTPSSPKLTCDVNPTSIALNGTATATVTVRAQAGANSNTGKQHLSWLGIGGGFILAAMVLGKRLRKGKLVLGLASSIVLAALVACGGGSSGSPPPPPPSPPPNRAVYSVVVTATSNSIVHNTKVTVVVERIAESAPGSARLYNRYCGPDCPLPTQVRPYHPRDRRVDVIHESSGPHAILSRNLPCS